MRTLVTGADGYLGSHVCALLEAKGHEVIDVDAGWFSFPDGAKGAFSQSVGTITKQDLDGVDVVLHLAWFSSAGNEFSKLQSFSLDQTKWLVGLCQETETRLIFASTASVYGFHDFRYPLNEEENPEPVCAYGRAKLAAEDWIRNELGETQSIITRKGTLMGIGARWCRTRLDLAANAMIASAVTKGVIKVWDPETVRPMYHVLDAAQTYVKLVEEFPDLHVVNLSHKNYTMLSLAHWIKHLLGNKEIRVEVEWSTDDGSSRSYQLDCSKAAEYGLPMGRGVKDVVFAFQLPESSCTHRSEYSGLKNPTSRNVPWMKEVTKWKRWLDKISLPEEVL